MGAKRINTVTQGSWSVSTSTPAYDKDFNRIAGAQLSVFRELGGKTLYGDGNGKLFETSDLAFKWALEHGYSQVYRKGYCPRCRIQHWFCGGRMYDCAAHSHPYPGCEDAQVNFDKTNKNLKKAE